MTTSTTTHKCTEGARDCPNDADHAYDYFGKVADWRTPDTCARCAAKEREADSREEDAAFAARLRRLADDIETNGEASRAREVVAQRRAQLTPEVKADLLNGGDPFGTREATA